MLGSKAPKKKQSLDDKLKLFNTTYEKQSPLKKRIFLITCSVFFLLFLFIFIGINLNTSNKNNDQLTSSKEQVEDYVDQDAKTAYTELIADGYSVKFKFDRDNNGGFSESDFQSFVIDESFVSKDYSEMPFVVTKQSNSGKNVTLYIDYGSSIDNENQQAERDAKLEAKLSIINATTACQEYGERNYRDFTIHLIFGKISEYASDENTWFLKYYVDTDGYENLTMECYVTGTTSNPEVSDFLVY
jgi:hypothetical protein